MDDHPAGVLMWQHTNQCPLRAAEDARTVADRENGSPVPDNHPTWRPLTPSGFTRPTTTTERVLLAALGYALPAVLTTEVRFVTPTVRRRTWPSIGVV